MLDIRDAGVDSVVTIVAFRTAMNSVTGGVESIDDVFVKGLIDVGGVCATDGFLGAMNSAMDAVRALLFTDG